MRTLAGLTGVWGLFSWAVLRQWRSGRAGARLDEHVKQLLAGALVPAQRAHDEHLVGDESR